MRPRYRIHLDYINALGEPRYSVQRRVCWFCWEGITHFSLSKSAAQAVLETLLREDAQ